MRFTVGKKYQLRGITLIYVGYSRFRGITRHFTYENGGCRDVGPDEVSQIVEGACS